MLMSTSYDFNAATGEGLFIGISGLIGAGKTTLATALAKELNLPVYYEPVVDNVYLEDFYGDMAKYSFPMQIYLLSKCTLSSPALWPRLPPLGIIVIIRQLEFYRITILTRFVIFDFVFLRRDLFVVCGALVFLFFVAPSLAVFESASVFNQDVSNWNTRAVTTMESSKCTLSPSL